MSIDSLKIGTQVGNIGAGNKPSQAIDISQPLPGASFRETLDKVGGLQEAPQIANPAGQLKFSSHAVERMQSRGIRFDPDQMDRIHTAVDKARDKGAKETLVLADAAALIVSVKNNTVVTVMDSDKMKENVFTNIDSTVMI